MHLAPCGWYVAQQLSFVCLFIYLFRYYCPLWNGIFISVIGQKCSPGRLRTHAKMWHAPRCLRDWKWKTNCERARWSDTGTRSESTPRYTCACVRAHSNHHWFHKQLWKSLRQNVFALGVCIQSIISIWMFLQIFVDVFVILCDFFYASIKHVFAFAQPVDSQHWSLCSPISAVAASHYGRSVWVWVLVSVWVVSYNWGQISKPVRCQNISTTLCLHLLLWKIPNSLPALNNFYSPLTLLSHLLSLPPLLTGLRLAEQLARREDEAKIRHRLGLSLWASGNLEEAQHQVKFLLPWLTLTQF